MMESQAFTGAAPKTLRIQYEEKVFNIIQIGDKSNRLSRLFDIFIAIVICANILVTFLQTFDELALLFPIFHVVEVITILIFCVEYILRIWTADYLYPDKSEFRSRLRFLISFDGIIDLLTILPFSSCPAWSSSGCCGWQGSSICSA